MKEISLYGAGGHCYASVELIRSLGEYDPIIVFDDAPKEADVLGVPIVPFENGAIKTQALCITIGNNEIRKRIVSYFDLDYPSFVHKSAVIYPSTDIGKGTMILANSVLDADVHIGDFCFVNNNATISHNAVIGNFVHIAIQAAVAGGVHIGEGSLIGAGSVVLPEIKIGKWVVIGAGAVVTKDIPDYSVVYGNPAKIIRNLSNK